MARVTLDNVTKRYPDGFQAVSDLTLDIADGEFMVLVGPSGSGKSTALRMIAGLEEVTDGELRIGEQVVNDRSPKDRDIAMVFQSYALYPHMTVAENLGFSLRLAKLPSVDIDRRVREAAELLGLADLLDRKPKALSGGQRQRVAMGRAIVRKPQAFLMDEPLSNLDARLRVQMRAEISSLQRRLGVTTIYVTHDQIEAMTMGDRVAVLEAGVLQQVGSPQQLYERPDNLFVAGFIGSPAMNLMEGHIKSTGSELVVRLGTTHMPISPASVSRYPKVEERIDQPVIVGMRPEHFHLQSDNRGPAPTWPQRQVTLVELLGAEAHLHFETSAPPVITDDIRRAMDNDDAFERLERNAEQGQTLIARVDSNNMPRAGDSVDLGFRTENFHFFDIDTHQALR